MNGRGALPSSKTAKKQYELQTGIPARSDRPWAPRDVPHASPSTFQEMSQDEIALFQRLHRQMAAEGVAVQRPNMSSATTAAFGGSPQPARSARFSEVRHLTQLSAHEIESRWALRHKGDIPDELIHAFNIFADEKTGKISVFNLQRLCHQLGEGITLEELTSMFDEVDRDGDGEINLDEFISIMAHGDLGHEPDHYSTGRTPNTAFATDLETGSVASSTDANPQEARQRRPDPGIIFQAIEVGDEARALAVLGNSSFSETNAKDGDGCTVLHLAAAQGLAAVCYALLSRSDFEEVNTRSLFSWTALNWAARYGHLEAAKVILEHPRFLEVNAYDGEGRTALHYAAYYGHVEVVKLLLSHFRFTGIEERDCIGQTALHTAALSGRADVCRAFIKHPRMKGRNMGNREGDTALHCAAAYGYIEVCRALLEPPRPVFAGKLNRNGKTALDLAQGECALLLQQAISARVGQTKLDAQQKAELQKSRPAPGAVGGIMGPPKKRSSPGLGFIERQSERAAATQPHHHGHHHDHRQIDGMGYGQGKRETAIAQPEATDTTHPGTNVAEGPQSSSATSWFWRGASTDENTGKTDGQAEVESPPAAKRSSAREQATLVLPAGARLIAEPNTDDLKLLFTVIDSGNQDATFAVLNRLNNCNGRDADGCTVLHRAAERGQADVCRILLSNIIKFSDANLKNSDSCSALHLAALNGYADACRVILEHAIFSEADAKDCTGCSALHHAALNGHAEVCQALLDHPRFGEVNARDYTGCTALHFAADHGHIDAARTLVCHQRFTKVGAKDKEGNTALHFAAGNGRAAICGLLMEHAEVLDWKDARNRRGFSAMDIALGEARQVLSGEADAHQCPPRLVGGQRPEQDRPHPKQSALRSELPSSEVDQRVIFEAIANATNGSEANAISIISSADFTSSNGRDADGCTALHRAAERGLVTVCQALLGHPNFTDANSKNGNGMTALHYAALNGYATACWTLLEHPRFSKMNSKDCTGCSALHLAGDNGHAEACKTLLDHPRFSEAESRDRIGWTALHYAALGGHAAACRTILDHPRFSAMGARDFTPMGRTALGVARGDAWNVLHEIASQRSAEKYEESKAVKTSRAGGVGHDVEEHPRLKGDELPHHPPSPSQRLTQDTQNMFMLETQSMLERKLRAAEETAQRLALENARLQQDLLSEQLSPKTQSPQSPRAQPFAESALSGDEGRKRFGAMRMKELKAAAREAGITEDEIEGAEEADRPKEALIDLIAARQGTRDKLQKMTFKELKQEARLLGALPSELEQVEDAEKPKLAVIDLIVSKRIAEALRAKLQSMTLKELKAYARDAGVSAAQVQQADKVEKPKAWIIERIIAQKLCKPGQAAERLNEEFSKTQAEKQEPSPIGIKRQKSVSIVDGDQQVRPVPVQGSSGVAEDSAEEAARKKDQEARRKEEERKRQGEEAKRKEEERKKQEEARKREEERKKLPIYEAFKLHGHWWKEGHLNKYEIKGDIKGDEAPTLTILPTEKGKPDITAELKILGKGRCSYEISGQKFEGEVTKDGKLSWSNGAKWFRADFDGVWRKDNSQHRYIIEYETLRAKRDGKEAMSLKLLGDGKCEWNMHGHWYQGELSIIGKLRWSNGSAWIREEVPEYLKRPGREPPWKEKEKKSEKIEIGVTIKGVKLEDILNKIKAGDEEGAIELISQCNGEEGGIDDQGKSALHYAAEKGLQMVCRMLLRRPTFECADSRDRLGCTALHLAARNGHVEVCKILLDHERFKAADVQDNDGCTAFHYACGHGHDAVVQLFLDHARFTAHNAIDLKGSTALHHAAGAGHLKVVKQLLTSFKFEDPNVQDKTGATALHNAAHSSHAEVCTAILADSGFVGANFVNKDKRTALHFSAYKGGGVEACKAILDSTKFTAQHAKDSMGFTVLHYAALKGHAEICQVLIDHPRFTALDEKDINKRTALDLARGDARRVLIAELG